MDENENRFNYILFKTMRRAAYTQKTIAEKLEVEINTIVNWEKGKFTPSKSNIAKIENLFRVSKNFFNTTTDRSNVEQEGLQKFPQKQHKETWIFRFLLSIAAHEASLPNIDGLSEENHAIIQTEILALKKALLDARDE